MSIGKEIERSTGCTVNVYMNDGYPAIMNPPELYKTVRKAVGFFELDELSLKFHAHLAGFSNPIIRLFLKSCLQLKLDR